MRTIIDVRKMYLTWHGATKPNETVTFPLTELDLKAFCVALAEAGYWLQRINTTIFKGVCMWVSPFPAFLNSYV